MPALNTPALPRSFHRLTLSNLLAHSAEQIGLAATPIVAVLVLNAGAGTTALLQAAQTLPFLILSLPLGLLADSTRRSRVMVWGETLRAVSLLLLVSLVVTGQVTLPMLTILGFVGSVGTVAYTVAAPSLVSSIVKHAHLSVANGRTELVRSIAFAAGPAIGGAIVGWMGASWAYAFAAGLSILAVAALGRIHEPQGAVHNHRRPIEDMGQGVRFLAAHPLLRPVMLTAIVFNIAWYCLQGIYVAYAITNLGHSSTQVGIVLAMYGVGMLAGALAAPHVMARIPFCRVVAIGPIAGFGAAFVMTMSIWTPFVGIPMTTFFLLGAGPIIWTISTTTLRQSVTPITMLGRVSAVLTMATAGARPIGAGVGALVATVAGVEWCLLLAAAGFLGQALIITSSSIVALDAQPSHVEPEAA
jgi:predicted MFS family arabinose efflux permease